MTKALWLVHTHPVEGKEDEYNDWYDNTHVKDLLQVPGILSAVRYETVNPGEGRPHYLAVYEIDADDPSAVLAEVQARQADGRAKMTDTIEFQTIKPFTELYVARGQ